MSIDLACAGSIRIEIGRRGGRLGIGSRRRGSGHIGIPAEITRGIGRAHPVVICIAGGDTAVAICISGRCPDLRKGRASRALAALHQITRYGDIVGGGGPGNVDLGSGCRCCRQIGQRAVGGWVSGAGVVAAATLEYPLRLPAASVARTL